MNVIASNQLKRDETAKPVLSFPRPALAAFTAMVALGLMPMMPTTASAAYVAARGHMHGGHHYGYRGGYHHYGYGGRGYGGYGGYGYNNGCAYGGCGYGGPGGGLLDGITRGFGPM